MRKIAKAKLVGDTWHIKAPPHIMLRLKRVMRGVSQRAIEVAVVSDSPETCRDLEWFGERYPIGFQPEHYLKEQAERHRQQEKLVGTVLSTGFRPRRFRMALPARKYQRHAAELALAAGGLLIADDLGLGKSATAIAMLTEPTTRPALVVVPAHLQTQWKREIEKFVPKFRTHILKSKKLYDPGQYDVLIISYPKFSAWAATLAPVVRTVIYDEVQELRHGTETHKGTAAAYMADKVDYRLGLSATPIHNYGGEIYNVINVLRPGALGTEREFAREWCESDLTIGKKTAIADPAAFGAYARESGIMLRRTRKEVGRELPPLIKSAQHIDCDPKALTEIEEPAGELARIILGLTEQQIDRTERYVAGGRLDAMVRQATGIGKAPYVAEFTRMVLEAGERVVLYGWHHAVYALWKERLKQYEPAFFTGKETAKQKDAEIRRFIERETPLLIMSLRSGAGVDGLQYCGCNTVINGELDWSPAVHEQGAARLHRDGQKEPVVAYFLIADDGSDPLIASVLGLKRAQLVGMLDPTGKELFGHYDTGGLQVRALAERYLKSSVVGPSPVPSSACASSSAGEAATTDRPTFL